MLAARIGIPGRLHVLDPLTGQRAVRRPGLHIEVHVSRAVVGGVGVTALDQFCDHLDHLGNVSGGARLVGRRQAAQRSIRVMQFALETVGVGEPGCRLSGLDQDLVVDVGDIGDHGDFVAAPGEPAAQDVEDDLLRMCPRCGPDCTVRPQW